MLYKLEGNQESSVVDCNETFNLQWLSLVTVFSSVVGDDVAFWWICMIRILQTLLLRSCVSIRIKELYARSTTNVRSQVYCLLWYVLFSIVGRERMKKKLHCILLHYIVFWFLMSYSRFYTAKIQYFQINTCFFFSFSISFCLHYHSPPSTHSATLIYTNK